MKCYCIHEGLRNLDDNSKNIIFYHYFSYVDFSITIAYEVFKFSLHLLHTHLEGTVSPIFNLDRSLNFMPKIGKYFVKFVNIIF